MRYFFILILSIVSLPKATAQDFLPDSDILQNFDALDFKAVQKIEKNKSPKQMDYETGIGRDYYPNAKGHKLSSQPWIYESTDAPYHLTTSYYYSLPDSQVRVILYQWITPLSFHYPSSSGDSTAQWKANQAKFETLKTHLVAYIGEINKETEELTPTNFLMASARWWINPKIKARLYFDAEKGGRVARVNLSLYKD